MYTCKNDDKNNDTIQYRMIRYNDRICVYIGAGSGTTDDSAVSQLMAASIGWLAPHMWYPFRPFDRVLGRQRLGAMRCPL